MGTKNNPGEYDCYDKAEGDEPLFTLLARDPDAAGVIHYWIELKEARNERELGSTSADKLEEAEQCAVDMEEWRLERS